jgi:hypothetical protein
MQWTSEPRELLVCIVLCRIGRRKACRLWSCDHVFDREPGCQVLCIHRTVSLEWRDCRGGRWGEVGDGGWGGSLLKILQKCSFNCF